jgi:hypothetical protein
MPLPTPRQIARAWNGIKVEYGCRRNKMLTGKQWEVYCLKGNFISDDTLKVISVHGSYEAGCKTARALDNDARAKAVLGLLAPGQ